VAIAWGDAWETVACRDREIVALTRHPVDGMVDGQPAAIVRAVEEVILGAQSGQVMAELDRGGNGVLGRKPLCSMSNRIKTC